MLLIEWEVLLLACLTSVACGLTGAIALLRRQALMGDALGHSLLAGIGAGYWIFGSSQSPWLFPCAVASGLLAVALVELVSRWVGGNQSTALGLIFPAFFSVGVVLISLAPKSAHIDLDRVLTGNLDLAPLVRFEWEGKDMGPLAVWTLSGALTLTVGFILLFRRLIVWQLFDPEGAQAAGFTAWPLTWAWLVLSAVTITLAFETMGTVMVVSLLVAPGAGAWLLTRTFTAFLAVTVCLALLAGLLGRGITMWVDASTTATTATTAILIFLAAYLIAPGEGLFSKWSHSRSARRRLDRKLVLVHLWHHGLIGDEDIECKEPLMVQHLAITPERIRAALQALEKSGMANVESGVWKTTHDGSAKAKSIVEGVVEDLES